MLLLNTMRGSRKFCKRVSIFSNFDNVLYALFLNLMRGERGPTYHYKRAIIGPSAKRHLNLNGVSLGCVDGPTFNAGLAAL